MVRVEKFFGFQLPTAGLIVGWYGAVESVAICIVGAMMLANADNYFTPDASPDLQAFKDRMFFLLL